MDESSRSPSLRGGAGALPPKPFVLLVVKRLAVFLFLLFLIVVFYWTVGSFSSFIDETQLMLLGLLRWLSLALAIVAPLGALLSLLLALFRRHSLSLIGVVGYAFLMAFGVAGLVLADGLVTLSRGIG